VKGNEVCVELFKLATLSGTTDLKISNLKQFEVVVLKTFPSNKIFSGTQPRQLVAGRNRRFGNYFYPIIRVVM
jgi:hypothetical protein